MGGAPISEGQPAGGESASGRGVRRRELLVYGGAATAVGALSQLESSSRILEELLRGSGSGNLTATMLRADDFLALEFEFFNMKLLGPGQAGHGDSDTARLVRKLANVDAFVVVRFQPQAIAEQTFWEKSDSDSNPPYPGNPDDPTKPPSGEDPLEDPPVSTRLAGPSRLAFKVPNDTKAVPFNDASLLAWERWVARVVPAALPPTAREVPKPRPKPTEPLPNQTAIEVPWRVILSTHAGSAWAHSSEPVENQGRTELWHTRLAVRAGGAANEANAASRTVRAVWTPGFNRNQAPPANQLGPFRMPLTPLDRWELVELSSDFALPNPTHPPRYYTPKPIKVDRLMLTSLGAWVNSRGDWDKAPSKLNIVHWTERGTMGREHYVKVVKRGFLFPFRHAAALIQISERKIQKPADRAGDYAAYLRKRAFLLIKEPERTYSDPDMPLRSVRIRTVVTPDLDKYDGSFPLPTDVLKESGNEAYGEAAFWPQVQGQDFLFNIAATDFDGKTIEFSAPLIFVLNSTGTNSDSAGDTVNICERYEADEGEDPLAPGRRTRPLEGQRLAYAKPSQPGDTSLETENLVLGCEAQQGKAGGNTPRFRPRMAAADVRLSAVEAVKGPLGTTRVEHHPVYLDHGIDSAQNKSQSFLRTESSNGVGLDYGDGASGDRCGGIGAPNMKITGISRSLGPTGGVPDQAPPKFDPATFLSGAKFLGINFADVLVKDLAIDGNQAKLPKTVSETVFPGGDPAKPPTEVVTRLDWHPQLTSDEPVGIFLPSGPGGDASMALQAIYRTPLNPPGEPEFEVSGDLRSFRLVLFGSDHKFLILHFNRFAFLSRKGQKPKVDVDIAKVEFTGPLQFVQQLQKLVESNGNGFDVDVAPDQVAAGYTLGFPSVPAGVFTLKNIAFTGGVTIPFTGQPVTARFGFAEKSKPFLLTYTIFGGGGFFEIAVGAHGIEGFQAALEFGASAEIDLGPASGGVEIMAGVYFAMAEDDAELTGYVRLHGELDILGVISVSLSFYLGMTYDFGDDELWGQCTLTVEVEVWPISGSVEVSAEKRFAGGGGSGGGSKQKAKALKRGSGGVGPEAIRFEDLITTQSVWEQDYVGAFAPEAFA